MSSFLIFSDDANVHCEGFRLKYRFEICACPCCTRTTNRKTTNNIAFLFRKKAPNQKKNIALVMFNTPAPLGSANLFGGGGGGGGGGEGGGGGRGGEMSLFGGGNNNMQNPLQQTPATTQFPLLGGGGGGGGG